MISILTGIRRKDKNFKSKAGIDSEETKDNIVFIWLREKQSLPLNCKYQTLEMVHFRKVDTEIFYR